MGGLWACVWGLSRQLIDKARVQPIVGDTTLDERDSELHRSEESELSTRRKPARACEPFLSLLLMVERT